MRFSFFFFLKKNLALQNEARASKRVELDAERVRLEDLKKQYDAFGGQNIQKPFGEVGQMKYETYRAWMDRIDTLRSEYRPAPSVKLSDLVGRSVLEAEQKLLAPEQSQLQQA